MKAVSCFAVVVVFSCAVLYPSVPWISYFRMCHAHPTCDYLSVHEQLEKISRIRRMGAIDRVFEPYLRALVDWYVACCDWTGHVEGMGGAVLWKTPCIELRDGVDGNASKFDHCRVIAKTMLAVTEDAAK